MKRTNRTNAQITQVAHQWASFAEIDELMRAKFGSARPHGRVGDTSKEGLNDSDSESLKWSSKKTAEKLGIGAGQVSEAKTAVAHVEKYPELVVLKTPKVIDHKKRMDMLDALPDKDADYLRSQVEKMDQHQLKVKIGGDRPTEAEKEKDGFDKTDSVESKWSIFHNHNTYKSLCPRKECRTKLSKSARGDNIMNIKAAIVLTIIVVAGIAGGLYLYSIAEVPEPGTVATLPIDFTPMDRLAGTQDAATSAVLLYNTDLVLLETVTMDAASKASVLQYTTGDVIGMYIKDSTDVSICEEYHWYTVPRASAAEVYGQAFQFTVWQTDRNLDPAMNVESDGTEITDGELEDLTTNGWNTAYAYIDFEIRPATDDLGYVNTDNFLRGYENNHYFVISIADVSGSTLGGWFAVNLLGSNALTLDRNDVRYYCFPLSDTDLKRDLQSDGTYDPTGLWVRNLAFDITSFDTGNNVTISYNYKMYASWNHFVEKGSWGADVEDRTSGAETFHIQY